MDERGERQGERKRERLKEEAIMKEKEKKEEGE